MLFCLSASSFLFLLPWVQVQGTGGQSELSLVVIAESEDNFACLPQNVTVTWVSWSRGLWVFGKSRVLNFYFINFINTLWYKCTVLVLDRFELKMFHCSRQIETKRDKMRQNETNWDKMRFVSTLWDTSQNWGASETKLVIVSRETEAWDNDSFFGHSLWGVTWHAWSHSEWCHCCKRSIPEEVQEGYVLTLLSAVETFYRVSQRSSLTRVQR